MKKIIAILILATTGCASVKSIAVEKPPKEYVINGDYIEFSHIENRYDPETKTYYQVAIFTLRVSHD